MHKTCDAQGGSASACTAHLPPDNTRAVASAAYVHQISACTPSTLSLMPLTAWLGTK
jgi:hypothetical protein